MREGFCRSKRRLGHKDIVVNQKSDVYKTKQSITRLKVAEVKGEVTSPSLLALELVDRPQDVTERSSRLEILETLCLEKKVSKKFIRSYNIIDCV